MDKSQEVPTLSVIIPTLNEASHLPLLLADLRAWPYKLDLKVVNVDLLTIVTHQQMN